MSKPTTQWAPDRGDMIWIDFTPQAGNEMAGRHPLLVLSTRAFNEKMGSVMGLAMTSQAHPHNPFQLKNPLSKADPSFINTNQISTFDWRARKAKPHPMGTLSSAALKPVLEHLNAILQLPF